MIGQALRTIIADVIDPIFGADDAMGAPEFPRPKPKTIKTPLAKRLKFQKKPISHPRFRPVQTNANRRHWRRRKDD